MRILRGIHTAYGSFVFLILFIIFFFPLLIPIAFPKKFSWVGIINRLWAKLLFTFVVLPYKVESRSKLDPGKQYIFCPNHFSYLDIPTMGLNPINTIFVGKNDMEKVPFFGFMYGKLHITVDRNRLRSKYETFIKSGQAIDDGKSLVLYPEGGIFTENAPAMVRFKDGAFRLAIEKQIPIVPVTIPYNWIILPPDEFLLRQGNVKVIFHEPIETNNMTLADVDTLKQKVFTIIEDEICKYKK
ncbi:MAG: 1-acyl-sn-glycerol-3-phosphate acyltransferase [Cyclobacteriaceae bacterium]|nr:1-acyl-sn-glycerol-3-phosphate acyltransferase [Cyclobacteriaceae bacterium]